MRTRGRFKKFQQVVIYYQKIKAGTAGQAKNTKKGVQGKTGSEGRTMKRDKWVNKVF